MSFDRVAEAYDETRSLPSEVMKRIVRILVDELKGYKTVLDAGVGTGRYAKPLQDSGSDVVGLDVSSKMLRRAAEKGTGDLLKGDVYNLPFKGSSFDVTISASLLHLVKDWKKALIEITRVTRDLLISVVHKNPNPLSEAYTELLRKSGYTPQRRGISEWELKDIAKPTKVIPGPTYELSIKERLTYLNQRAYSHQWDIPEDLHKQIMRELKKRFNKGVFCREAEVLIWRMNRLEDLLQQTPVC